MKKILLGLSVLSVLLFASCDKETNVAKAYEYTLDEEFVDNSLGWKEEISTYIPKNQTTPSDAYIFKIDKRDNGTLSLQYYATKNPLLSTYIDAKDAKITASDNFKIETTISFISPSTDTRYSGIVWDYINDKNYSFFGISETGFFIGYDKVNGTKKPTIDTEKIEQKPSPSVYKLEIDRTDSALYFKVNNSTVHSTTAKDLISSKVGFYNDKKNNTSFHYLRVSKK